MIFDALSYCFDHTATRSRGMEILCMAGTKMKEMAMLPPTAQNVSFCSRKVLGDRECTDEDGGGQHPSCLGARIDSEITDRHSNTEREGRR
jgi:hypothetical protein